ncbi:hypothetical protein [Aerococcus urinaeequi]|uniref:hypothetical protein n=1 Tax=Aerococcus urinaeequi TaxID=51665 RepID=UPI003ED85211
MEDKTLPDIFEQYETVSLGKAIYTITSWGSNRQYIGASDTLNKTFIENEENSGPHKIITYKDFQNLFKIIAKKLNKSFIAQENFYCDTGEVKFYSEGKFHKIILGNGSEDTYEACFFIESIVQNDEYLKDIWQEILYYEDYILSNLYTMRIPQNNEFECPPEEYFNSVFKEYDSLKNPKLASFFRDFRSSNEELYEFFTPINELPIFLPMLKESFLEKIEQNLTIDDIQHSSWNAIINQFVNNYQISTNRSLKTFISLAFTNKAEEKDFIIENSFALLHKNDLLIFIPNELDAELIDKLITDFKQEKNTIVGATVNRKALEITFNSNLNLIIQKVDDTELSPNIMKLMLVSKDEALIDIKGMMGIINFASDIEEIIEFIKYFKDKNISERTMNMSGITSYFQTWQDLDNVIVEGVTTDLVFVPPYQSVERTVELYSNDLINYPFNAGLAFSNIHRWSVISDTTADLSLLGKDGEGSVDIFVSNGKKIIYRELHYILEDMDEETIETIDSFHEIITNAFDEYKERILSFFKKDFLEISLISERILNKYATGVPIMTNKYNSTVIINSEKSIQKLLINPYWEKIASDNVLSKTKSFENDLLVSFINGVSFNNKESLELEIRKTDDDGRTSSISRIEVPYYINTHLRFESPKLSSFKLVRKILAQIIKDIGLEAKNYEETEILGVIKQFRNEIRRNFIQRIEKIDKFDLHTKLLNIYSSIIFQIDIHQKRLSVFNSTTHLEEETLHQFRDDAIDLREESKVYKQVLEYVIEENLIREDQSDMSIPSDIDLNNIIAYGKWIIGFQNMSDSVNYGAAGWNQLGIREDYVVEIEETNKYIKDANLIKTLRYNFGDYSIRDQSYDKTMLSNEISSAFLLDTGVSLQSLFATLSLLYSHSTISILADLEDVTVTSNVVMAPIETVANLFLEETDLPLEDFYKVIDFINLKVDEISDENGVIPIWEKKKRKNKFSAQPVLVKKCFLIFSPITLYELEKTWYTGITNFILPYNNGLEKLTSSIDKWKTYYEHKIVIDLASLFDDSIYDVYTDKELYKLDPKGNHPRNIGDYDLIAVNNEDQEILLFEVKYMRLSQTMKDFLGDQGKYFLNKKAKAKQFERRVTYFEENVDKIVNNIGLEGDFKIKKYFLTNKNIRSFFKEYPFKVVSFNEFKETYFTNN